MLKEMEDLNKRICADVLKGFTLKCRYHQMINRYNVISPKIPMVFAAEIGKAYSKIHINNPVSK